MLVQQILKKDGVVKGIVINGNFINFEQAVAMYNQNLLENVVLVQGKYFRGKHGYNITIKEVKIYENERNAGNLGQVHGKGRRPQSDNAGNRGSVSGSKSKENSGGGRGGRGSQGTGGNKRRPSGSSFGIDDGVRLRLSNLGCRAYRTVEADKFKKDFDMAKTYHKNSACVDSHSVEELSKMKCLRTDNGFVAVEAGGNINSVLKDVSKPKTPDFLKELLTNAVANGATKLDCFAIMSDKAGGLADMYARHGFIPVVKDKFNREFAPDDWNYQRDGEPDVVFMYYCGDSIEEMHRKIKAKDYKRYLEYDVPYIYDVPKFKGVVNSENSYDMCGIYRDAVMEGRI